MVKYEELHAQNHHITELTNILKAIMADRTLLDAKVTCELFFRYVDAVKEHLDVTDRGLYAKLLASKDNDMTELANKFMSGSQEIKRMFDRYLKKWCKLGNRSLAVKNHEEFVVQTDEIFDVILDRIQDETEKLYPVVREISGEGNKAA
jgi:hemerythrin-like domain-containing protein